MEEEFNDKDVLSDIDFKLLKQAFDAIDIAVDRRTESGALVKLWRFMDDFIEFNEDNR